MFSLKHFLIFLFIVSCIGLFNYLYVDTGALGIDDGNIFLNYAHHLAHGQGFVFNTNGEKVEGFTSFLWVIVCAFFYVFTEHPELLLIYFSAVLTAVTITYVFKTVEAEIQKIYPSFSRYFFWLYCVFIISIGPSFIAWNVLSLMENSLWNFLFTSLVILVISTVQRESISLRKRIFIVLAGCLLMLTRPEALLWNLVFFCMLLYTSIQSKRKIFYPLIYLFCTSIIAAALTVFRIHYFGFRFPNTYYAKVSSNRIYNLIEGAKYAMNFLAGYQPVVSFLFVVMFFTLLHSIFKLRILTANNDALPDIAAIKKFSFVTVIILIGFALPCTTGGDHFGGFRFYQDILLLFSWGILILVWLFKNYRVYKNNIGLICFCSAIAFLLIIGLNNLLELKQPAKTQLDYEFFLARKGRSLAEELNNALPANKPSVGLIEVGGFGLVYQGETIDLMGLNNILMGHSPGDRKGIKNHAAFNKYLFYKLNPDILLPESKKSIEDAIIKYTGLFDVNNFDNEAMKNIFNDAAFQKLYLPVYIFNKKSNSGFFAFVNNNYINKLVESPNISIQKIR